MRTVTLKRGRIIKFGFIGLLTLSAIILILKNTSTSVLRSSNVDGVPQSAARSDHQSHPGDLPVFMSKGNLGNFEPKSDDIIRPKSGPGEAAAPHFLKIEQKVKEDELKTVYGFNQLVSDEISLNRSIPDLREDECKYWNYPTSLPKASVILVFHNEGWSTLFRTIHSVINRSPPQYLKEVILVDDKSELEHLHEQLESTLEKPYYKGRVVLVRNEEREGLIRSRNNGAVAATGDVVIFLDAHCEVDENWLPPLLAPIYENRKTLSVPIVDGIDWNTFAINPVYAAGTHSRGLFEWGMLYKEGNVPDKEQRTRSHHSEPYNAPTHAGGLFAIDREWFKELGWYDPGLYIWGGENFELSFKTWMCGGRSVWVPCSRVAHVYRGHSCSSCHSGTLGNKFKGQPTTLRNYRRVIETWFDDKSKEYFYTREPMARFVDMGDITEQLALKERLQCKSFDWFMKEVAYDVFYKYPALPPNKFWGELVNEASGSCLDSAGRHPPEKTSISGCHGFGGNQLFRLNTEGQLTSGEWCHESDGSGDVAITWCVAGTVDGPWVYRVDKKQMYHKRQDRCLALNLNSKKLNFHECDDNNSYQKWIWREIKPYWST